MKPVGDVSRSGSVHPEKWRDKKDLIFAVFPCCDSLASLFENNDIKFF